MEAKELLKNNPYLLESNLQYNFEDNFEALDSGIIMKTNYNLTNITEFDEDIPPPIQL